MNYFDLSLSDPNATARAEVPDRNPDRGKRRRAVATDAASWHNVTRFAGLHGLPPLVAKQFTTWEEVQTATPTRGHQRRIVFANFNKVDKLDPDSFRLWMQVLRQVRTMACRVVSCRVEGRQAMLPPLTV